MKKHALYFFTLYCLLILATNLFGSKGYQNSFILETEKDQPEQPLLLQPLDQSIENPTGVTLSVIVSDPGQENLMVTFYGRKKLDASDEFTIVGLPDTQYYTGKKNNGTPEIFYSQTQWIVENRETENIVFVSQLGDCVENGDQQEDEWKSADTAMMKIEDSNTTMLPYGVPYAIAVGNHDQTPFGDPNGTTVLYNNYFGESRFLSRPYYGGHYGSNNDNSFQFFNAGGMDFIVIHIEYDPAANGDVMNWADSLLNTYKDRRAIFVSHFLITPGNPGYFSAQGQAIYDHFKDNNNVFLMLGGHYPGEGQRTDIYSEHTIFTLLSDYQGRPNGGDGWLRLMRFSPETNSISIKTFSPWLDEWEQDTDSEFMLSYNMDEAGIKPLGMVENVLSGSIAEMEWSDLDPNSEYEWFVEITNGTDTIVGPWWSFTTGNHLLNVKVFLEGPFANGMMHTELIGRIPLEQPYSGSPWFYDGTESAVVIPSDVVDWVLVELRDAVDPFSSSLVSRICRMAAFLKSDGDIVLPNGVDMLAFSNHIKNQLYIAVWHRNHLSVLSSDPLVNNAGVFTYNFTLAAEKTLGEENGCKALSENYWGMVAGDSNADGQIDIMDKADWDSDAGYAGYLLNDLTLDQQTNNLDKNTYWLNNLGRTTQVPE